MPSFSNLRASFPILKTCFNALPNWKPIRQQSLIESQKSLNEALLNRSECQDEQALIISNMILNRRRLESAKQRYLYLANNERLNEHYYEEITAGLGAKLAIHTMYAVSVSLYIWFMPYDPSWNSSVYLFAFLLVLALCIFCQSIILHMNRILSSRRGYCAFVKPFFRANEVPERIEDNCIKPALSAFYALMSDKEIEELAHKTESLSILGYLLLVPAITLIRYSTGSALPFGLSGGTAKVIGEFLLVLSLPLLVATILHWSSTYQTKVIELEKRLKSEFPWYNPRVDGLVVEKEKRNLVTLVKRKEPAL